VPAGTFRSIVNTHRRCARSRYRHTEVFSAATASQPFSSDRSFGDRRRRSFTNCHSLRSSTVTILCYVHLCCNRFQLHIPLPQRLIVTAPSSEVMDGTRRRTPASHSSSSQASHSTIQILQSRTVPILKPVNPVGDDIILGTATDARVTTTLNATTLPVSPPHSEDIPPPPLSPEVPPTLKTNEVLTNLVNLFL
jgi:hypothetical protein